LLIGIASMQGSAIVRVRMHPPLTPSRAGRGLALLACAFLFGGCAAFFGNSGTQSQRSSSVVAYLYPNESNPLPPTSIPVLSLPLRVGVAFVPESGSSGYRGGSGITETQKNAVMQRVADEFKGLDYIQSIQLVPASYLRAGGGFTNLEQVRNLLGVDVVALIAYDQVQFTDENVFSLSYWTIVGAYLFQGNRNDTQTLMEAAVYDISSRHLLFRAPGAAQVKAGSAAMYLAENLRKDSAASFDSATTELIANLKTELASFQERVKTAPGSVQIVTRPGYRGSSALGGGLVGLLAILLFARLVLHRR
jgi:rhombotail lipoprotein